jgi:hypothetical protein
MMIAMNFRRRRKGNVAKFRRAEASNRGAIIMKWRSPNNAHPIPHGLRPTACRCELDSADLEFAQFNIWDTIQ